MTFKTFSFCTILPNQLWMIIPLNKSGQFLMRKCHHLNTVIIGFTDFFLQLDNNNGRTSDCFFQQK